jgi:hypothetical protein
MIRNTRIPTLYGSETEATMPLVKMFSSVFSKLPFAARTAPTVIPINREE